MLEVKNLYYGLWLRFVFTI